MLIRISPELLIDLRDHLRGAGCVATRVEADTLQAAVPDAPSAGQERREVRAYLATWSAARGVDAEIIEDETR